MRSAIYRIGIVIGVILLALSPIVAAQCQNGIPVLLYHHVCDAGSDMPQLTVSTVEFERQMRTIKENGFQTISLDELIAFVKGQTVKLPEKPIVITFDDGYKDNYTYAYPILRKYNFAANIFMVGINFDRENRLSSQQIREMAGNGFTVGGHSMTHPALTALSGGELRTEVYGSKKKAEQVTHKSAKYFAYPCGFYNLATLEAVEAAGYEGAFTVLTGLNKPGFDNVYLLRRIPIYSNTDFDRLLALLNANQPKTSLFDYSEVLSQD